MKYKTCAILVMALIPAVSNSSEAQCLADIMHSESSGESIEGLIAVAQASINRSIATKRPICLIRGVTRKKPPQNIAKHYVALAQSILDGGVSIVGKADSWERSRRPKYACKITRRIEHHTFYVMKGLHN